MARKQDVTSVRGQITDMRAQISARLNNGADGLERRALEALDKRAAGADLEAVADAVLPQGAADDALVFVKYVSVVSRVISATRIVKDLGLDHQPPMDILDLGAGGGFFCFAAQVCGHRVVALEPKSQDVAEGRNTRIDFAPLIKFLGVAHSGQPILPGRPLQRDEALREGMRFDLVTAFAIMFNRGSRQYQDGASSSWAENDYYEFLDDLKTNFLKPGGKVFFRFNERLDGTNRRAGRKDNRGEKGRAKLIAHHADVGRWLAPYIVEDRGDVGVQLDLFRSPIPAAA